MDHSSSAVRECHVAVFTGGVSVPPLRVKAALEDAQIIVAADSGLHLAFDWDLPVQHVVGDMDSVNPILLEQARALGATVTTHPTVKDATDLELALNTAVDAGATRITVVGGVGGRLDHLFGTACVLTSDRFADVVLQAFLGASTLSVVRNETFLHGMTGELVGLFALNGPAVGVTTHGLLYPLTNEMLAPGSSRGVSNRLVDGSASVSVRDGVVLSVQSGIVDERQVRV